MARLSSVPLKLTITDRKELRDIRDHHPKKRYWVRAEIVLRAAAGQIKRALFVCDRDEPRSQGAGAFQNLFGADAASVSSGKPQKNARVLIATYQTLDVDSEEKDTPKELLDLIEAKGKEVAAALASLRSSL